MIRRVVYGLGGLCLFIAIISTVWNGGPQAVLGPQNLKPDIPDSGTRVHFIGLSVGEATLIQTESGQNVLIDTGSAAAQQQLFQYLDRQGIRHLDALFVTNENEEHIGNLNELLTTLEVSSVYFPYQLQDEVIESFSKRFPSISFAALRRGDVLDQLDENMIHILHPAEQLNLSPQDNSLVLQWTHGKNRFLFTSDITHRVEGELTRLFELHSQILKVSDFGSNVASSSSFLKEVDAHVGIVFYRPEFYLDPDVVERLEESWMDVYPIKEYGHIVVVSVKDDYELYVLGQDE